MKEPKPKIHILYSPDPLLAYQNLSMVCGEILRNAETKYYFDHEFCDGITQRPWGVCNRCFHSAPPRENARYEYGLIEGQQARAGWED